MPNGGIPINIDPTLLILGPLAITWHGVFTAVGTLVSVWLAVQLALKAGFSEDDTISIAMWGIVGGVIGARLFHIADQWDFYRQDPQQIVLINEGGLAIFGTVVCGPLLGAIFAWRRGLNVARLADVASIPLVLGMGLGRVGDVLSGEQHGAAAQGFPFAVQYTNPNTLGQISVPVHLATGYELVLDLGVFAILVWLARAIGVRRGRPRWNWDPRYPSDGMVFWTFLALYSVGRFVVEFYRQDTQFGLGLTQAQLVAVVCAMASVWALVYSAGRATRTQRALAVSAGAVQPGPMADSPRSDQPPSPEATSLQTG